MDATQPSSTGAGGRPANGLEADMVSTGGTPNLANIGKLKGTTEHRAGTYIFNDRTESGLLSSVAIFLLLRFAHATVPIRV